MTRQPRPSDLAPARRWLRRLWPDPARRARRQAAHRLYEAAVKQARTPVFYDGLGVPDTPEGRFEMTALHVALLVRRLRAEGAAGRALGQELFDLMFADMDESLRRIGVGDLSVGKYVKRLAGNFYARLQALDQAFATGAASALRPVLEGNLYHGAAPPAAWQRDAVAGYLIATDRALDGQAGPALLAGRVDLVEPTSGTPGRAGPAAGCTKVEDAGSDGTGGNRKTD